MIGSRIETKKSTQQGAVKVKFSFASIFTYRVIALNIFQIIVYEIINNGKYISTQVTANFDCQVTAAAIFKEYVICMEVDRLTLRTFQGITKQVIALSEMEGTPTLLDVSAQWMSLATKSGFLRVYDLTEKEATQRYHSKHMGEYLEDFKSFIFIRMNCEGNRVCFTYSNTQNDIANAIIAVWDAETGTTFSFDLCTGMTDQQLMELESFPVEKRPLTAAFRRIDKEKVRFRMSNHLPGACHWDAEDPRFLVCEANSKNATAGTSYLLTMFVTSEHGIQMHDVQERSPRAENLIGMNVPLVYSVRKADSDEPDTGSEKCYGRFLLEGCLKEFSGLDGKSTKKAMLNFSFYLTIGRMDEAFKEIKFIKSDKVWDHMAIMCVKTRRLDVALLCLGNMGHARGARAIRDVMESGEPHEVQIAYLAIQLGLHEEAEMLFKKCGRYDLVNKLYQSLNNWNKAFEIAKQYDRIHLRNTHYVHAAYLEANSNIEGAIKHYEASHTHYEAVPRLLIENPKKLEAYIKKNNEPKLNRWWAQYLESHGDIESALHFYRQSSDYLSIVRLLCYNNITEEAKQVAESSGDRGACYHLARYFENNSNPKDAINFFAKANAYNSAIRIAKEYKMVDQLTNLALVAGQSDMLEVARFYEQIPGQTDKAVMLYHKGGMIGKAMELAFSTQQFTALDLIAKDLNEHSDSRMLEKAAMFYAKNQQYTRALELLAYAKNYVGAIEFCKQYNVSIDEEMAEMLTPPKASMNNGDEWRKMVENIAECCVMQQNYYSAAKKYTQAGNKIEAMRCLLKTGNTEKIIFFANTARNPQIYVLAANYLQTLDWKNDENVLKHIILLYTKSNSFEHLTGFYEACATAEIDDYRNYEKACAALNEAQRCLSKALEGEPKNLLQLLDKQEELKKAILDIKKFMAIRNIYDEDPVDAVRQVEILINNRELSRYIRFGDLYAILIVHNVRNKNYRKAYGSIKQLQQQEPGVDVERYVNSQILDKICDETGNPKLTTENSVDSDEEETQIATVDYSYALQRRQRLLNEL